MTTATAPAYTDEQLRAAWAACRLRCTFEEAMADPVRARLVRLNAWHLAHPNHRRQPARAPVPQPRRLFVAPPPGFVDCKRAAAGDRDDD